MNDQRSVDIGPVGPPAPGAAAALLLDGSIDRLDGHTIDELQDYLDVGGEPRIASIEGSAACRIALDALQRLRRASLAVFDAEVAALPATDESWVTGILRAISREAGSGRRIPLAAPAAGVDVAITEGALRGAVRTAGDEDPDVLVGSVRFDGDLGTPTGSITVRVTIAVRWGRQPFEAADASRGRIVDALSRHSRLRIGAVDLVVTDLWGTVPIGVGR